MTFHYATRARQTLDDRIAEEVTVSTLDFLPDAYAPGECPWCDNGWNEDCGPHDGCSEFVPCQDRPCQFCNADGSYTPADAGDFDPIPDWAEIEEAAVENVEAEEIAELHDVHPSDIRHEIVPPASWVANMLRRGPDPDGAYRYNPELDGDTDPQIVILDDPITEDWDAQMDDYRQRTVHLGHSRQSTGPDDPGSFDFGDDPWASIDSDTFDRYIGR